MPDDPAGAGDLRKVRYLEPAQTSSMARMGAKLSSSGRLPTVRLREAPAPKLPRQCRWMVNL